jgi:L-asparagine oxygenase
LKGEVLVAVEPNSAHEAGEISEICLTTAELADWAQAAQAGSGNPYGDDHDFDRFRDFAVSLATHLPRQLTSELRRFAARRTASSALLIRGLEVNDAMLGPTPKHWELNAQDTSRSFFTETYLLCVTSLLGEIFAFGRQRGGMLVENLVPIKEDEFSGKATSSRNFLDWHTEDAYDVNRADFIAILCVRGDENAQTAVAPVENADLRPETIECLTQERFQFGIDLASGGSARPEDGPVLPILIRHQGWTEVRVDLDCVAAWRADPGAAAALEEFRDRIGGAGQYVTLRAGDLLVIDNKRALHARTGYSPRYDGTDRWLQRVSVTTDFERSRGVRGRRSRVIDAEARLFG